MASTIPPYLNGNTASDSGAQQYSEFYEKLFSLQKEVYAGKHPRIRLPNSVLEQVSPRAVQNVHSLPTPLANGTTNLKPTPSGSKDVASALFPPFAPAPSKSLAPPIPANNRPSSGIDPVLLTKSDDLVRAEIQLKRQRIERSLKDQVDAKKGQSRDKDFALDTDAGFDVSDILNKAHELVKPLSGLRDKAPSDSFDEDSYYSSKANSWSTEEKAPGEDKSELDASTNTQIRHAQAVVEDPADEAAVHIEDADPDDEYEPTADLEMIEPEYHPEFPGFHHSDDDYSPPPADPSSLRAPFNAPETLNGSYQEVTHRIVHSPETDVPIIRSQIRSPVAPQPSRISPLATAKQPRPNKNRNGQQGQQNQNRSRQTSPRQENNRSNERQNQGGQGNNWKSPRNAGNSPKGPKNGVQNARKRRREAEQPEKSRKNTGKRIARSPPPPEPIIKEEPVSPPPFGVFAEPQQARRRLQPYGDEVEIVSPKERMQPVYQRDPEPRLVQRIYDVDEPPSPGIARMPTSSRATQRRMDRDDQDLRRVASLQYARRPQSPIVESRSLRAASHAYVEQPPQPIYRSASIHPPAPQYIRERSRSPVYADEGYVPRVHTPGVMGPPPPRAFVLDEYGNKYYAAPPERSRLPTERLSGRESMIRTVRTIDPYEDDNVIRMPPPARRYVEQPDMDTTQRQYRVREYSVSAPSRDEYGLDRRPTVMYEDMAPPQQQYVSRSYSMRPDAMAREPGVEYVTRHQSVAPRRAESVAHPGYREVSVHRGEQLVPLEAGGSGGARYGYRVPQQQQRRYVEEVDPPMEMMQEEGLRRVSYRYGG